MFTEGTVEGLYGHSKILLMTRAVLEKKLKEARAEGAHSPTVEAIAEVLRDHPTMMEGIRAAVQAATPCPCKSRKWQAGGGVWYFVAPTHDHTEFTPQKWIEPGDACPICGDALPPKPPSAMTIEECAEECPSIYFADRDLYGWRVYRRITGKPSMAVEGTYWPNCLAAWQAAADTHRRGGRLR